MPAKRARTYADVCRALGVSLDTLSRWRALPGSPGKSKDVARWAEWATERGYEISPQATDDGPSWADLLPGKHPYDAAVTMGFTYKEAIERERARGELLANEQRKIERDRARKDLITSRDAQQMLERQRAALLDALLALPDLLSADAPPESRMAVRRRGMDYVARLRSIVAEKLSQSQDPTA